MVTVPKGIVSTRIPVLTYHSLDKSGSPISTSPEEFRWQMEYLREDNWHTLALNELVEGHARGAWPARTVALTFDDGFRNFGEQALPILAACGFSATLFIVTDWIGVTNGWSGQSHWMPTLPLMDWDTLSKVANVGIEIGAHSLTHPHLPRLSIDEAKQQIVESQRRIEQRIGRPVHAFAYPYGETTVAVEEIVSEHFRCGFTTRLESVTSSSSTSTFGRIDMYYLRNRRLFRAFVAGGLEWYIRVRHWMRFFRHRGG